MRGTGIRTKISTIFFENIDKIYIKISTKFLKNIDKIFNKHNLAY